MFSKLPIYYASFASGVAVMALEIVGLGILAPYFGTALLISANLTGVILTSLAIGYYFGGKWADRRPPKCFEKFLTGGRGIGNLLFISAVWVGVIFPWRGIISNTAGWIIYENSLGSLFATIVLFGFPCVVLGMVLPQLIKIHSDKIEFSGKSSGILYGLSTMGSILGTFLIGFVILPLFNYEIALAVIVAVLIIGALLLKIHWRQNIIVATVSFLLLFWVALPDFVFYKNHVFFDGRIKSDMREWKKLDDKTSIFSRLQVYEGTEMLTGKLVRFMLVNGEVHSASYLDSNELVLAYARYNRLGGHFNPMAKRALLIGGGAYSYANYFLTDTPLYDVEKVWKLDGKFYHNNKTVSLPVLFSNDTNKLKDERVLVYESKNKPEGRQTEGLYNNLDADNQKPTNRVIIEKADILDTSFDSSSGYVHIHETSNDGTPGKIISSNITLNDYLHRPRAIVGKSALISGENKNIVVPLSRSAKEGEVLYPMLHRDNGNGHFDEFLLDGYEQIEALDVVEIDPRTTELAEKYFHLNIRDPRLRIFHEDGRTYLNNLRDTYDIIYLDAFQSFYGVPSQLTTIEATKKIFRALNNNGVVVANIPASLEGEYSKFFQAELKTYQSVFPEARAYATLSPFKKETVQNIIIVAFKNKETIREFPNDDLEINEQLKHRWIGEIDPKTPILSDDFAPTDYYTSKFVNLHSF